MLRSLWTASTGMKSQQTNLDVISNNISNVNTTGYKTQNAEFKSLLYQTIQTRTTSANGEEKPIGAQVGLGTRTAAIDTSFTDGSYTQSDSNLDFAITGKGFFSVTGPDGGTYYTRNGEFNFMTGGDGIILANSDGYPVLTTTGGYVTYPANTDLDVSKIVSDSAGNLYATDADGNAIDLNAQIAVTQFSNPNGLTKTGGSLYQQSDNSGEPMLEATNANLTQSKVLQGYIESSNVQVVDEMVDLIVTQRAYELNSKAITTSDTMLEEANNLKR